MSRKPCSVGRLFILPPGHERFHRGIDELEKFLCAGHPCYAYLLDDAVLGTKLPEVQRLRDMGLHLTACAFAALQRKIPLNDDAVYGGLVLLADILERCDDFAAVDDTPADDKGTGDSAGWVTCVADDRKTKWARRGEAWRVAAGLASAGLKVRIACLPTIPENPPPEIKPLMEQAIDSHVEITSGTKGKTRGRSIWFGAGVSDLERFSG